MPCVAVEIFPRLLHENPRQAFGESLAHLNMLASRGSLKRKVGDKGAVTFVPTRNRCGQQMKGRVAEASRPFH